MDDGGLDELLVLRCQLGDRAALSDLVRRWHPPLWGYLRHMVGRPDAVDDLVQEVWLAVVRGLPGLRRPDRFPPWLFTLARRAVVDLLRREGARPVTAPLEVDPAHPDDGGDGVVDRTALVAGLRALPLAEREAAVLFHLQDWSLEEVAAAVGAPVGTVKSRLFRARRLLRDRLTEEGYER